jgi:hypothetical protein
MSDFLAPKWDAKQEHYVIETSDEYRSEHDDHLDVSKDEQGNTIFTDLDAVHNVTDEVLHSLIEEGGKNKWFSKLPSHEQLMKRTVHSFTKLASAADSAAYLSTILMTPKRLTFMWTPIPRLEALAPGMYFEDSDTEPEISESSLPPVALNGKKVSHEEYLLTRLRAAKAKVEAEQIRMEYFEATGQMPPDSDSEDE